MKNVIKLGFLALSFGLFAVACGGGEKPASDSAAINNAANTIDSAAAKVDAAAGAAANTIDSAAAKVDSAAHSAAAKVDSAVKH
ncbi:hypothetical protein [Chitinophaga qingshengii]|uniref:Lipoprotein n=1 Tax=Chitinophaga qingshengii TaxID=1569794 RepID=A0ABR7TSC3_9BACT|nr:hypothetical protein [Chitinophaga qingshengii]MBC9932488.1 hypothetical protein [Chitinophaga qingshengii]